MARQVGHQILHHAHRADAGAAAAVGDAECFVEIEVAHVPTEGARRGDAHQGIHIGTVDIDAAAVAMDDLAEFADLRLKHAMGAGIGDHHSGEPIAVLRALGPQFVQIDISLRIAAGDHHFHPRHLGAGRIGAMGGGWDQADGAVALTTGLLPGLDHEQASIFPLAAGIRLEADAGVAGRLAEPGPQLAVEQRIALQLIGRREGVQVGKLGPRDRDHLAGGIELHRAAAEGNHAAVEGEIPVAQAADIAEHRRFAVVGVEHRVRQEAAGALEGRRDERLDALLVGGQFGKLLPRCRKHLPQPDKIGTGGRFIERD